MNFGGGAVSSDGGLLLLREVDRRLKLTERVAAVLHDPCDPDLITLISPHAPPLIEATPREKTARFQYL